MHNSLTLITVSSLSQSQTSLPRTPIHPFSIIREALTTDDSCFKLFRIWKILPSDVIISSSIRGATILSDAPSVGPAFLAIGMTVSSMGVPQSCRSSTEYSGTKCSNTKCRGYDYRRSKLIQTKTVRELVGGFYEYTKRRDNSNSS